jgi:hypothetical protein
MQARFFERCVTRCKQDSSKDVITRCKQDSSKDVITRCKQDSSKDVITRCKQDSSKDAFGKGIISEASFEKSYGVSFSKPIYSSSISV